MGARKKPELSVELIMLRRVMIQDEAELDKDTDPELSRYRDLMKSDPKWVLVQRRAAEKEYRDELEAWRKENRERAARKAKRTRTEPALEPCEVLVTRMLDEWDKVS